MKQKTEIPRLTAVRSKSARHTSRIPRTQRRPQSDRERRGELARLLPLWPKELADLSLSGRRHIIRTLERALRCERKRGRAGHWAYDLARHAALIRTWRSECASLRVLEISNAALKQKSPPEGGPE